MERFVTRSWCENRGFAVASAGLLSRSLASESIDGISSTELGRPCEVLGQALVEQQHAVSLQNAKRHLHCPFQTARLIWLVPPIRSIAASAKLLTPSSATLQIHRH